MIKSTIGKRSIQLIAIILTVGFFSSCGLLGNKDKEDNKAAEQEFTENHFSVMDGKFRKKELPKANSSNLDITNVSGNSTVLAGGSNNIKINTVSSASALLVGIEGVEGYFEIEPDDKRRVAASAEREFKIVLLLGQQLKGDTKLTFLLTDGKSNYGTYYTIVLNLLEAGTGTLQISLSWDQPNDVDLHLFEPEGGARIFYNEPFSETTGGMLDVDSNPLCRLDNINNENITYDDESEDFEVNIIDGVYEVKVDLYTNCDVTEETNYTVVALFDGKRIKTIEGDNPHNGILTQRDESYNRNNISVMKFEARNGAVPTQSSKVSEEWIKPKKYVQFNFPENEQNPKKVKK